ncbi:hypothetical protein VTO42DRAFT_7729 [Malbranchea cinnamomea]
MRSQASLQGSGRGLEEPRSSGGRGDIFDSGGERGSRRKKVYDYLKAANELRQAYSAQWSQRFQQANEDRREMPGGLPDAEPVIYGNEEMVLFPSYARRHVRSQPQDCPRSESDDSDSDKPPRTTGDSDYWQRKWEQYQDDHAIIDVDVKGWIYSPHQGPLTRKNRILIALARRLSGIPAADTSSTTPTNSSPSHSSRTHLVNHEDAIVSRETRAILNNEDDMHGPTKQESSMSQSEIAAANAQLMERLDPFLRNPVVGLPVTVFFFDEKQSQSRTVTTNAGGHFNLRAALEFVPTHVRVLAGENLSATSEVKILEPKGVSMISDIDDTIKHSAIASGAKEMFRNTFVRSLSDLTIMGVKEWYTKVADMGVGIHYVSNSPWQLYPLLQKFFSHTGLPNGSFHLKQYSGMLQGIFEPTSERKRSTLERIIQDFPQRRFILVGDSGEADLEAYTDLVLANPGRILAIFIRDVTTSKTNQFFDKSVGHLEKISQGIGTVKTAIDNSDADVNRPALPPRRPIQAKESVTRNSEHVDPLIDIPSENESLKDRSPSTSNVKKPPPPPPPKPAELRGTLIENQELTVPSGIVRKPVPPVPEKPERLSPMRVNTQQSSERSSRSAPATYRKFLNNDIYLASIRNRAADIYNSLPPSSEVCENRRSPRQLHDSLPLTSSSTRSKIPPPAPPPRRSMNNSVPLGTSRSTPDFFRPSTSGGTPHSSSSLQHNFPPPPTRLKPLRACTPPTSSVYSSNSNFEQLPTLSKREEAWNRRWTRAQEILSEHGVLLASWRVGSDVQDLCVTVIEQALADEHQARKSSC